MNARQRIRAREAELLAQDPSLKKGDRAYLLASREVLDGEPAPQVLIIDSSELHRESFVQHTNRLMRERGLSYERAQNIAMKERHADTTPRAAAPPPATIAAPGSPERLIAFLMSQGLTEQQAQVIARKAGEAKERATPAPPLVDPVETSKTKIVKLREFRLELRKSLRDTKRALRSYEAEGNVNGEEDTKVMIARLETKIGEVDEAIDCERVAIDEHLMDAIGPFRTVEGV